MPFSFVTLSLRSRYKGNAPICSAISARTAVGPFPIPVDEVVTALFPFSLLVAHFSRSMMAEWARSNE